MRCSEQTLAKYATQGCGPEYHRYGRDVVYVVEKLDEWAQTRLSPPVRSTSQTDAPAALGAGSEHSAAAAQSFLDGSGQLAAPRTTRAEETFFVPPASNKEG
jgi:hypothetical protein